MKTEELTCSRCGLKARYMATSPAAAKLSALEEAEKDGWSYRVGFFSMMTGDYHELCPRCTKGGIDE